MRIIHGYLVITFADGSYSAIPMPLVIFLVVVVIIGGLVFSIVCAIEDARRARYANYVAQLPTEIASPQPVDFYAEQTARALALKEKLDADTVLAESYLNTMRTKGELDELPDILRHEQAKRIASSR